jgi:hypothetical protein
MPKAKPRKMLTEGKEEIVGKHFKCGGFVKLKRAPMGTFRYCEKCGSRNDKEGAVFTQYEAAFWK